ncbi:MAG: NAD(P)/FAD-dependent oxidoreductase [Actinomycetota bacterium]
MTEQARIVVVGAGLAGLACAYRLSQVGVHSEVFEARDRLGGRCWSAPGLIDGQVAEHGGEFIDPDHVHLHRLIGELGLELEDRGTAGKAEGPTDGAFVTEGMTVPRAAVDADVPAFVRALEADLQRAGEDWSHDRAGSEAKSLDSMSAQVWFDANLPDPSGPLAKMLRTLTLNMFGAPPERISSLVVLELFASLADEPDGGSIFGWISRTMNGTTHVRGGNDLVVSGMADRLPSGSIHIRTPLEVLRRSENGRVAMRFGGLDEEVVADRVVLTLPFTALREVAIDDAGLSPEKLASIRELGMGTNTKLLLGMRRRVAAHESWRGWAAKDEPDLFAWDTTIAQPGASAILTVFTGERVFDATDPHGPPPESVLREGLAAADVMAPGLAASAGGVAWLDSWPDDPWSRGSYAVFLPGQVTRWLGFLGLPEGPVHFAGEHTSTTAQGYLEGAVESGERAAREVQASVGIPA